MDELIPIIAGERSALAHGCLQRDISMAHLHVMNLLAAQGPLSMSHLAALLRSGLPTVTGLVSRMEERGLLARTHATDDRRVVLVSLTDQGRAQLEELTELRRRRLADALAHLDPTSQRALVDSIRSLRAAFELASQPGANS